MTTLLVGRGLLGSWVLRSLAADGVPAQSATVTWSDPELALRQLLAASDLGRDWRLVWTAGAGVMATSEALLDEEAALFERLLAALPTVPRTLFLASSVGGAYGRSPARAPYTEHAPVGAGSAYGHTKLAMEAAAGRLAGRGTRVVLGRITNLYGPGQDLSKPQGLVSQLCLAQLTRRPLGIHAPFDTLRDYLYVQDAARMVVACVGRAEAEDPGTVTTKILASGSPMSIGEVLGHARRTFRRRPRIYSRVPGGPASDLRVRSEVWPEVDRRATTPFVVGLRATAEDIAHRMWAGEIRAGT